VDNYTDEVDQFMNQAEKAGGAITDPTHDRGGVYSGYFQDLDDHLWEILCRLGKAILRRKEKAR
jgi:predicted lactoylglutathione lyase